MCQQWFSILGVVLSVAGFLLIAIEWHHMFKRDVYLRRKRIERDYAKSEAEQAGQVYDDDADLEYTMWREFQRLLQKDTRYRSKLFYSGVGLVLLGAALQIVGSWPGGFPFVGLKGC